jgi:hypothetical protein
VNGWKANSNQNNNTSYPQYCGSECGKYKQILLGTRTEITKSVTKTDDMSSESGEFY